jgi:chromosome segregation ATPase
LDKQVADRDAQLATLRDRLSHAHEVHSGAGGRSHDTVMLLRAAQQRGANMQSQIQLLQMQLQALGHENDGLRTAFAAEQDLKLQEVAQAREARLEADALETRSRGLRTMMRIAEHQLKERTDEVAALRTQLSLMDELHGSKVTAAVDAQLQAAAGSAALTDAHRRTAALQRQLAAQREAAAAALDDAAAAGAAADSSRQQAAALSAELHRADARAAAMGARAAALQAALESADVDAAELKSLLLEKTAVAGTLSSETSTHVRGLEAQVRGLQGRIRALDMQLADGDKTLTMAHEATAKAHERHQAAAAHAAQHEAEAKRLRLLLGEARKAADVHVALATEREAGMEALRGEISELLSSYDKLEGQGRSLEHWERAGRAAVAALTSQVRSLEATLAEKDADAALMQQAQQQCAEAVRAARRESATAHERCEMMRKQVAALHAHMRHQEVALEETQGEAAAAKALAERHAEEAGAAAAEAERLQRALRKIQAQKILIEKARSRHDHAAAAAACAVADAQRLLLEEQDREQEALTSARGAAQQVEELKRQLQGLKGAYEKQGAATEVTAAAGADLRAAMMDQQEDLREVVAALVAAEARAARVDKNNCALMVRVAALKLEVEQRGGVLGDAHAALQEKELQSAASRADALRTDDTLQRTSAHVQALTCELKAKTTELEVLRSP